MARQLAVKKAENQGVFFWICIVGRKQSIGINSLGVYSRIARIDELLLEEYMSLGSNRLYFCIVDLFEIYDTKGEESPAPLSYIDLKFLSWF